jgi:hypothetical protein
MPAKVSHEVTSNRRPLMMLRPIRPRRRREPISATALPDSVETPEQAITARPVTARSRRRLVFLLYKKGRDSRIFPSFRLKTESFGLKDERKFGFLL